MPDSLVSAAYTPPARLKLTAAEPAPIAKTLRRLKDKVSLPIDLVCISTHPLIKNMFSISSSEYTI